MSVKAVAKKEFRDSVRRYTLHGLTLLFLLFAGFLALIQHVPTLFEIESSRSTVALLNSMRQPTIFFVPAIGLVIGYSAIVGERESGTVKVLLGLPNSRRDVVLGKFLGRTAVVAVAILASYLVVAAVALLTYETFALEIFVIYTLLTVGYGAVYVALAIGFSAATTDRGLALGAAMGLYLLFLLFWNVVLLVLQVIAVGWTPPATGLPEWIQVLGLLNPSTAFAYAARATIPEYYEITAFPASSTVLTRDWVGFVVLAVWTAVPLWLGYRRFARADL